MTRVQIEWEPTGTLGPLGAASDDALADLATRGNGPAFSELARRQSRLVAAAMRHRAPGLSSDDFRQEALVGLLEACHAGDREPGTFATVAKACVRRRVRRASDEALRAALATLDRPVTGWPAKSEGSARSWR